MANKELTPKQLAAQKQQFVIDARRKLGVTQDTLAIAMGLADGRVVRAWELGQRSPSGTCMQLLRAILRHPDEYFEYE